MVIKVTKKELGRKDKNHEMTIFCNDINIDYFWLAAISLVICRVLSA
jgi:hypothetical protein